MKPDLTPSLETFTKEHHDMKSFTRLVRIVAVGLFLSAVLLLVYGWFVFSMIPSLGIDIDFASGTILQVFITNPNADVFTYEDRILSVDGIPINQLNFGYFTDLQRSYVFELMRPDGTTRFETVSLSPAKPTIMAERLAIPLLGVIPVLIGLLLVFRKHPDRTTQYLMAFLYLFGINIISGQLNRLEGGWISAVFYLSSLLGSWAFVEFHWSFLEMKPRRLLLWLFRGFKLVFVVTFLLASQDMLPIFTTRLLFWNSVDLLISFVVITTLFIRQATQDALHRGIVRTMFLSMVMAFMPIIIFAYLPILFNRPIGVPAIIVTLPVLLMPVNYFLLYLQQKNWIKISIGTLSTVTAFMLLHLIVRLIYLFAPEILTGYSLLSSDWVHYLITITSILIYFGLYHAVYQLAIISIYGNVRHSTQKMQKTSQTVLQQSDTDTALLRMGKVFLQEFYRFRYLNICLVNGTLMQYDENYQLSFIKYEPERLKSLVQTLAQGYEQADRQSLSDRMVRMDQIQPHLRHFPQIFGDKPQHCYLLLGTQGPIGFIVAGERRGGEPFDLMETRQLVLLLNQFQILIENILLLETVQNTSQQMRLSGQRMLQMRENERKRIARDMHDNIIQAITGFRYQLNELYDADLLAIADEEADELQHSLMTITQDIRDICFNLRPPALDATGLQSAVVSLVESYHAREALIIDVQIIGEDIVNQLSDEIAICLYRVLQETLYNAYQHARSREVLVVLSAQEDTVRLVVKDSGVGFTVPERINQLVSGGHFGLLGAQEFLEVVNGEFRVFSEPGKGATIEAIIPLVREVGEHGVFYDYCR